MASQIGRLFRTIRLWAAAIFGILFGVLIAATGVHAAPYAALVMDARSGEVLYAENADTRLHPASLTKMMTLYIAFEEIQRGSISLDSMVTVSKHAAAQPPSRLGLRAGQKIQLRYLIRAAAIKSANDAATAIGEFIAGGSEAEFAKRMTRTAKALGMTNSTFKNANGLTAKGHLSTAHDMTVLGRRLFYDFPQFYNLFSRRSTDAGMATVNNTNRRFLDAYKGADGIKTGYTVAAGFNLTASAERGGKRVIATIFGGKSTAHRNAKMADLLDVGFGKAPRNAPVNPPAAPDYQAADQMLMADAGTGPKTVRVDGAPSRSLRPQSRPVAAVAAASVAASDETVVATAEAVDSMADLIAGAVAEAASGPAAPETALAEAQIAETVDDLTAVEDMTVASAAVADDMTMVQEVAALAPPQGTLQAQAAALDGTLSADASAHPVKRNAPIYDDVTEEIQMAAAEPEVVVSLSTSGDRQWGINVGKYPSSYDAERALLKTQLAESATLNVSLRKVIERGGGFDATFVGLTQEQADLACRRLQARAMQCFTMGPG